MLSEDRARCSCCAAGCAAGTCGQDVKSKLSENRITSDLEVFVIAVESSRSSDFVKIVLETFSGGSIGLSSRIGGVWLNLRFVGLLRVSVEGKAFIGKRTANMRVL